MGNRVAEAIGGAAFGFVFAFLLDGALELIFLLAGDTAQSPLEPRHRWVVVGIFAVLGFTGVLESVYDRWRRGDRDHQ